MAHLAGFKGVLQADGYAGYRVLAQRGEVEFAFCWAHVRRRFYELAIAGAAPIAGEALERIAALYAVEREISGRSAEQRRSAHQEKSRPALFRAAWRVARNRSTVAGLSLAQRSS